MTKNELKIVYMGTPDFAVEPLRKLVEGGYNVVGVITTCFRHALPKSRLTHSSTKRYSSAWSSSIPSITLVGSV